MPTAYVVMNVNADSEIAVIKSIKEMLKSSSSVKYEIQGVYGVYDLVLKIVTEKIEDLRDLVAKIRRVDKIRSTITMLVIEEQET
ncbi:MAG: Lrp/AsnC ligand binding domain-containing protein [Nitrosopumilaceae archaeon]